MSEILEDFSPQAVVDALEANALETYSRLGYLPGGQVQESPEAVWFITGVASEFYNMVVRAQFAPDEADTKIEEIMEHFRARQVPMLWFLGPTCRPPNLGQRLEAYGLVHAGDSPGMAVDLKELRSNLVTPSGLSIQQVRDSTALRDWVDMLGVSGQGRLDLHAALGLGANPPWRYYLGLLDDQPVARSLLTLGAGVAGIYYVGTNPKMRQRGFGTALTIAALLDAREEGYRIGILQSSAMAYNLYRGLGFRDYCKFSWYSWAGGNR
jgi:ribosomal protein S18 acetylase RimI-like enzyme